jgi:uncharacterized membrane protein
LPSITPFKSTSAGGVAPAATFLLWMSRPSAATARVAQLAGGAHVTPDNARFFAAPIPVLLHIPAAIVFSILGAFQFSASFRRRNRGWHRMAGRVLVPSGLIVALSGLWMTQFYAWPAGDGVGVYVERLVFGSAMLASIVLGIDAIRQRKFGLHGEWMTRAYAIGLGAGTQVLTHLPWLLFSESKPGELPRAVMMGAGWVINIVVAELVIRRQRMPNRRRAEPLSPTSVLAA